jgi:Cellulose synthase operon protein C C-terminus (BCSC_C).
MSSSGSSSPRLEARDWSVRLDASVGYSRARTDDSNRFPLEALIKQVAANVAAGAGQPLLFDNRLSVVNGGSSSGSSYRVSAAIERRLGDRWVAGVGATLQRSRDFSPNTFQFYLRYTGKPWRGNLPMPVNVIIPYWRIPLIRDPRSGVAC